MEQTLARFCIEESVGFLLAKVHQRMLARFRDELDPFGVTPHQFVLLAFLWQRDGVTQVELSECSEVDRTTISGLVDRLVKAGLVERRPNPADRRAHLICLTEAGRGLEPELTARSLRVREAISADLAPGEYEQLCTLLRKLRP